MLAHDKPALRSEKRSLPVVAERCHVWAQPAAAPVFTPMHWSLQAAHIHRLELAEPGAGSTIEQTIPCVFQSGGDDVPAEIYDSKDC